MNVKKKRDKLIYETYIEYHDLYNEKYGKSAILMQCGDFYEIYGWETEDKKLGDVYQIADAAGGLAVASKVNGWLMAGFGIAYIDKYIPPLLKSQYTVIVVDQVTPPPHPERKVTRIISPSTYMDDNFTGTTRGDNNANKNKMFMAVFIEFKSVKKGSSTSDTTDHEIFAISMANMDLALGKSTLYSITASANTTIDKEICMDECFRFIHSMSPLEIIFFVESEIFSNSIKSKIEAFSVERVTVRYYVKVIPKDLLKMAYLQEYYAKFYPNTQPLTPIAYLGLTKYQSLCSTFAALIEFVTDHDVSITKRLHVPIFWKSSNYLIIENNGIYQLNVVKTHNSNKSLIDITDFTNTNIGKRLHRERLLNPIVNIDTLSKRYNGIEIMMKNDYYKQFEPLLKKLSILKDYIEK